MSRQLVESITSKNMIEASDVFEAKIAKIMERKMYEMKRMMQAEVFGGLTPAEIEARKKAGYRKAADVLGDPRDKRKRKIPLPDMKKEKKIAEDALDEAGLGFGAQAAHGMSPAGKAMFKTMMAIRRKGKAEPKAAEPKASAPKTPTDYEGKGNAPWTMVGRGLQKAKKAIADHKPEPVGTKRLKAAKAVGSGLAQGVSGVARELGSIGFSNLE